jgi:bifunctional non-homologous end joining protein LigD
MALDKYKQKRDFTRSPEPAGDTRVAAERARAARGRTPRFFCVQKHLASHLHYDFRLEHNGVLLSWAVPKGPALDPSIKRLAMAVEDHPIEYGEFEGVIPSGYGAGIVMLWDRGTWTPEVDDVDAALKKGDLKFTLDGVKLKGSWVLVRTKGGGWGGRSASGSGGDRSWLLIKHRDDWSGPVDIAEFAPLSVKSQSDFADILAQDNPDIWQSHRPAAGGEAGAMFASIIRRALEMRDARGSKDSKGAAGSGSKGAAASRSSTRKAVGSRDAVKPAKRVTTGAKKKAAGPKVASKRTTAAKRR